MKFSRITLVLIPFACAAVFGPGVACTSSTDETEGSRLRVLNALATEVIVPTYEQFQHDAEALVAATAAYAATPDNAELGKAANDAWYAAMGTWQQIEVISAGPVAFLFLDPGGRDIRLQVYPTSLRIDSVARACDIDKMLTTSDYDDDAALLASTAATRGLGAIEYLLFRTDSASRCGESGTAFTASWDALSDAEKRARRAAYSAALARLVKTSADSIVAAWSATGGAFAMKFATPGSNGSPYRNSKRALGAIADGMLYIDMSTRDMKIGLPLGLTIGANAVCAAPPCKALLEHPWSEFSNRAVTNNLLAFQKLLFGSSAPGATGDSFDDLLVELGKDELLRVLTVAVDAAVLASTSVPGTYEDVIDGADSAGLDAMRAVYDSVAVVQATFKTDVVGILDLERSAAGGSDTD